MHAFQLHSFIICSSQKDDSQAKKAEEEQEQKNRAVCVSGASGNNFLWRSDSHVWTAIVFVFGGSFVYYFNANGHSINIEYA